MIDSQTANDDLMREGEKIIRDLSMAQVRLERGENIDLRGLGLRIDTLCSSISTLSENERPNYLDVLQRATATLLSLQTEVVAQHTRITGGGAKS